jgi:D-glycero-beta-D-manno-heptose 1-phosphate adenylyltransferase
MKTIDKVVPKHKDLTKKIHAHKVLGHKIVCTIGSWDMLHIGHLRYLNASKEKGDILVVGVDSDRGIKSYKGPLRPVIPENERMEMLSYQDCVDYVTLVDDIDNKGNWQFGLLKDLPIDVFVAVEGDSYTKEQKTSIKKICDLEVIPRQALSTSSTDIIQNVIKIHLLDQLGKLKK